MSETTTDLWRLGAGELAAMIRSRRASSREVVEAHLARIEAVNPSINAVTVVLGDQALEAADAADRAAATGDPPPFHGVPFTVKANIDVAGSPTTHGLKAMAEAYPARDAPVVERLRSAGAIPIGRTNLPTFAVRWHTDSELWGPTVNPWDPALTPGASSGGEAAALATGMTPLGLGNDGLGSLRWPAHCCGICALKPTLGRLPHATSLEPVDGPLGIQITSVEGPMARRVADLRTALEVLAGPTWRDPWSVPAPLRGPELARPIRVALVIDPGGRGVAAEVEAGLRKAAGILEEAGYEVEEAQPPSVNLAARTLLGMLSTPEVLAGWQMMSSLLPADSREFMSAFYEVAGEADPVATVQSFMVRQSLLRAWGEFQETCPLILAPVFSGPPFEVGKDLTTAEVAQIIGGMPATLAANALGLPAVALPVGTADNLPQSVQLIGPRYREDLCLDAAAALEERVGIITPIDPRGQRGP